jgi:radical SAM superfamily enzyme YgiQ (UPF0313 family)
MVVCVLRQEGHEADLLDAAAMRMTVQDIQDYIRTGGYSLLMVLTSTMTIREDAEVLRACKAAASELKTVVWGSQPTFMPQASLAIPGIDIIVRREAEAVLRELVNRLDQGGDSWKETPGIGYRKNGEVVLNDFMPYIKDLDSLPIPDRRMLPKDVHYFNPVVKRIPFTTMFTTRGCIAKCSYCASPPFYGERIRLHSAARVVEEMAECQELGYREIFFRDELFTASKKRVMEICEGILSRGLDLTWICSSRVNNVDREMLILMKRAGCHMIRFGVESGVQQILDNIRKDITVEETRHTFRLCHEIGIDTHAHCMIGSPGETQETIDRSLKFVKEIDPTIITFGVTTPYPGTALFKEVEAMHPEIGDGTDLDLSKLHTNAFFNQFFTELSNEELSRNIRRIYRSFYFRPRYLLKWIPRIRSLDELRRVTLAGANLFDFAFGKGD